MSNSVLVIGGGAAGLMSAIMAAKEGAAVTLLEHNKTAGKKILATGNGRCNLTNTNQDASCYRGDDPAFAKAVLDCFTFSDTLRFFTGLGIYVTNKNGYLYPHSQQAKSVLTVLLMEAAHLKIKLKYSQHVCGIEKKDEIFHVSTESWCYHADCVIFATGSKASEIQGADESGLHLCEKLGHKLIPFLPALVPLVCRKTGGDFKKWAGVRIEGVVSLCAGENVLLYESGELQLSAYGISGIPVFQISRYAVRMTHEQTPYTLCVDFMPDMTQEQLLHYLEERRKSCPYKSAGELLIGLLPDKLIEVLVKKENSLVAISKSIKRYSLEVTGAKSFAAAQVCQGGISTREIASATMESKLEPGLYFAGEMIDIDGACGGYNLQWAWSSGAVAGIHAAHYERRKI